MAVMRHMTFPGMSAAKNKRSKLALNSQTDTQQLVKFKKLKNLDYELVRRAVQL
jgi:hypothetical protein